MRLRRLFNAAKEAKRYRGVRTSVRDSRQHTESRLLSQRGVAVQMRALGNAQRCLGGMLRLHGAKDLRALMLRPLQQPAAHLILLLSLPAPCSLRRKAPCSRCPLVCAQLRQLTAALLEAAAARALWESKVIRSNGGRPQSAGEWRQRRGEGGSGGGSSSDRITSGAVMLP